MVMTDPAELELMKIKWTGPKEDPVA